MTTRRMTISRVAILRSLYVLGVVVVIYGLTNTKLSNLLALGKYNFWLGTLLWLFMAVWVRRYPTIRPDAPRRMYGSIRLLAVVMAGFGIVAQLAGGLLEKSFGKSPYSFTLTGILSNLLYVCALLLGMEFTRSFFVNTWGKKAPWITIALTSLLLTALSIPLSRLSTFKDVFEITKYVGRNVLPALAEHIVASYLTSVGGATASIYYRAPLLAFHWFCPLLPNPSLITTMFVGTLVPAISLVVVQQMVLTTSRQARRSRDKENPVGWIITSLFSVGIVWFASGVFPIYPSVIATGSMLPMIKPGDVILVRKVLEQNYHVGSVIQYRLIEERIDVTHRIVEVVTDANGEVAAYVTQGDNNNAPDTQPVLPEQVRGEIIKVVPKVGWPTLLLKGKAGESDQNRTF